MNVNESEFTRKKKKKKYIQLYCPNKIGNLPLVTKGKNGSIKCKDRKSLILHQCKGTDSDFRKHSIIDI